MPQKKFDSIPKQKNSIRNRFESADEGTVPIDKSLLDLDCMYKVDPNDVWKTSKGYVPIGLSYRVIAILVKF